MSFLYRHILVCTSKTTRASSKQNLCYVPEIACLQDILPLINHKGLSKELRQMLRDLSTQQNQFGKGALALNIGAAKEFIEKLFNLLLQHKIALPPNYSEFDLKFIISDYEAHKEEILNHDLKIKINNNNLSYFAKNLPWIGTLVTLTLTIGLTVSSLITLLGWGWSILLLSIFGLSKMLTSYADISGGPERRLLRLGLWLDRVVSGQYDHYGKFSLSHFILNFSVISLLACNSFLTWYGAWKLIRCMDGMSYFPNFVTTSLAGLFAWSSAGATFGRIYQYLYQLVHDRLTYHFSFENLKESEKIKILPQKTHQKIHSKQLVFKSTKTKEASLLIRFNTKGDRLKNLDLSANPVPQNETVKRNPRARRSHFAL